MWRLGAKISQRCDVMSPVEHLLDKVIQPHPMAGHGERRKKEDPVAMAGDQDGAQEEKEHWSYVVHRGSYYIILCTG